MFGSSFSTASDQFENYYKDLCLRLKNRDMDMAIVVNMLLTGFDATTLNTLWVDKNLKQHGLMQAFSRTNRILNSVKTFGNIICFRDLRQEVDDALALFGDKDARARWCLSHMRNISLHTPRRSRNCSSGSLGRGNRRGTGAEGFPHPVRLDPAAAFATSCRPSTISPMKMC